MQKQHTKCLQEYPGNGPARAQLTTDQIPWTTDFPEYSPTEYTANVVASQPIWADFPLSDANYVFNAIDEGIDRRSFEGDYDVVDGVPQNPVGRTGMSGRGLLGKWGPNHAADPIVTRWKRDEKGEIISKDGKPVLQFVAIHRNDGGGWALPGGMVDPGEEVTVTVKREFGEEALNSTVKDPEEQANIEAQLDELFHNGVEIYKGYVDDPRNTDNAWMETVAINFHDESGEIFGKFDLEAGDDAGAVKWANLDSSTKLYASHSHFIEIVASNHGACF
eukprot:TRINITY_DN11583_c0_g1_i1.p1 TRINITY_DN11583_c0_g1~~TRINITY_DN11583_c0_g1_i1.p1  ORF type:complete len:288 (-),score=79.00 TRINITY_DN11583_c0_g1_i1:62-892(-)